MITLVLLQFHPDQTNIIVADGTHPLLKWRPAYRSPAGPCLLGRHDLQSSNARTVTARLCSKERRPLLTAGTTSYSIRRECHIPS